MPNDIPDWTAQAKVNLIGGLSGVNLGDVSAPSLSPDSSTSINNNGQAVTIVLASFKAAAGLTAALVGAAGAATVGTSTAVTPPFGQATTAGHLLAVAVAAAGASSEPTTAAAGWAKVLDLNGDAGWAAIWAKPNCGANETAPQFTSNGGGGIAMLAQAVEFSGVATASPTDQTGSAQAFASSVQVTAGASDVAFGDLILVAARWQQVGLTFSFTDTLTNGAAATVLGNAVVDAGGGAGRVLHSVFGVVPAATIAQPLGVQAWPYDSTGTSAPAVSTQAKVVLAATPGKAYTAALLNAGMVNNSAAGANAPVAQLLDGVTVIFNHLVSTTATAGSQSAFFLSNCAYKGTAGNSMTWQVSVAVANNTQSASIGAYLR